MHNWERTPAFKVLKTVDYTIVHQLQYRIVFLEHYDNECIQMKNQTLKSNIRKLYLHNSMQYFDKLLSISIETTHEDDT